MIEKVVVHTLSVALVDMSNYRAALDAGSAFCYVSDASGPARVTAGR